LLEMILSRCTPASSGELWLWHGAGVFLVR
jgi:hypothetical protein